MGIHEQGEGLVTRLAIMLIVFIAGLNLIHRPGWQWLGALCIGASVALIGHLFQDRNQPRS